MFNKDNVTAKYFLISTFYITTVSSADEIKALRKV